MNAAAVEAMIASSEALIAALDAHDIDAIEAALPAFGHSVEVLKSPGDWHQSPGLQARLKHAMKLAESARTRVRILADRNRQQIDMLATAAGRFDVTPATYGRPGR